MGQPITRESFGLCDPLRARRVHAAVDHSNRYLAGVRTDADGRIELRAIVVDALGNGFSRSKCFGERNVGRCIFENTELSGARAALAKYDALLVASHWNAGLIEAATGRAAKVIFEGVDTSLFCPGPKSGFMDNDKFYVYSAGKVELRKAQDLVLLAFRAFHDRRKDSVLVTAWHSPWPSLSAGFQGRLEAPVEVGESGMLDIGRWAFRNGLDPDSVIDIGFVSNAMMPMILREMDVALQPSRAEACTSLPVKEAMACGIPVIAAANTGMKDLLNDANCIALTRQSDVAAPNASTSGWGESDVDEIVDALELAYAHRDEARRIGLQSREWLLANGRTWQSHARELKSWLLSLG